MCCAEKGPSIPREDREGILGPGTCATGIIFDLDGTLAHTLPDIADAVNVGLASFGLERQPEFAIRSWIGDGLPMLCRRAAEAGAGDAEAPRVVLDQMVETVSAHYRRNSLNKAVLFPGVADLLDTLTARHVPFAILTNKPHLTTLPMVEALLGRWTFVAVEGCREDSRRKPDPRTALEIVARLGVAADRVVLVGDSVADVTTALRAGLIAVGVTWGYHDEPDLRDAGARHLIDAPAQLLDLID